MESLNQTSLQKQRLMAALSTRLERKLLNNPTLCKDTAKLIDNIHKTNEFIQAIENSTTTTPEIAEWNSEQAKVVENNCNKMKNEVMLNIYDKLSASNIDSKKVPSIATKIYFAIEYCATNYDLFQQTIFYDKYREKSIANTPNESEDSLEKK